MTLTLTLPFPPSVNGYYATWQGRRLLTRKGKVYKDLVAVAVMEQGSPSVGDAMIQADVVLYPPTKAMRDHDNYNKPLYDGLKEAGVMDDDSQVRASSVKWGEPIGRPGAAVVTLTTIDTKYPGGKYPGEGSG